LEAARRAGAYLRDAYARFERIAHAPVGISTDADKQAQEIILQNIQRAFPDDAVCAEEKTASLKKMPAEGARLWIVDPIDGTRGFAEKNGEFSVMVAFVRDEQIVVGVVLEPANDRLTYAELGQGCWRSDGSGPAEQCRVTAVQDLSQALLIQSRSRTPENA